MNVVSNCNPEEKAKQDARSLGVEAARWAGSHLLSHTHRWVKNISPGPELVRLGSWWACNYRAALGKGKGLVEKGQDQEHRRFCQSWGGACRAKPEQ